MRRNICLAVCLCALAWSNVTWAQSPFEEIGAQVGLTEPGQAGCPRWFDFEGDGDLDLLRTIRYNNAVELYLNEAGQFTRLDEIGLPTDSDIQSVVPVDFDRDGDVDLFLGGYHTNLLFMVNEGGQFVERAEAYGLTVTNGVRDYFWLDLDGDDWLDLVVQYINYWQLYRNDNGVRFVDITAQANLPPTTDNAMFALADYDLDNDGNGVFADVTEEVGLLGSAARAGCVFVDMNNDKYPDLVAPGNGTHAVWLNHHGEYFEGATVHGAEADFESMPFPWGARYAAGDYDLDGDYDFMVVCPGGTGYMLAENQVLRCDSVVGMDVWFTNMAGDWGLDALEDGLPRFADFDDDGDLDLILMLHDQPPLLYRNLTNGAGRLEVSVAGPNGEEYGWHRRVELYPHGSETVLCATVLGEDAVGINGMSNYFAVEPQQAYDIVIHLENGEILSPQSLPQLANVVPAEIGYKLRVELDGIAVNPPPLAVREFAMHPAYPNPFNPVTTISFELTQTRDVVFRVFNLRGQEVTLLSLGARAAGRHDFVWHADNLASGVYFGRLEAGDYRMLQKLVLLK